MHLLNLRLNKQKEKAKEEMEQPNFVNLLHAFFPNNYRLLNAAMLLNYQEPMVFDILPKLELRFFLSIDAWNVLPKLLQRFLEGYNPKTEQVTMWEFKDENSMQFQITMDDICKTLHFMTNRRCTIPHEEFVRWCAQINPSQSKQI